VIGAGALVISDIAPFSVSYGVPARHIRFRKHGDKYL
jgi:acetyltransferase-like isoleucine patch superfamily enzyme